MKKLYKRLFGVGSVWANMWIVINDWLFDLMYRRK